MEEKDLEFLREQLSRLDEPELPPSLTAEALFARLDEGTLALPEEAPAKKEQKVIPWGKSARRWLPLAACLALVLLLYRGYEVGLARNFSKNAPQMAASGAPEPAAAAPPQSSAEAAAYDADTAPAERSEETGEEGEAPQLRSFQQAAMESAEDSSASQKAVNSAADAAPSPPDPAPSPDGTPDAGSDDGSSNGSGGKPNPPTGGGGDLHPDTGGPDHPSNPDVGEAEPSRPPDLGQDSGENGPSLYKRLKAQAEEIATWYTPDTGFTSETGTLTTTDELVIFEAVYRDENRVIQSRLRFYCLYFEGKGEAWIEVQTWKKIR